MSDRELRTCTGCARTFEGAPVARAGALFCCAGCAANSCKCAAAANPRIVRLEAGPFSDQADMLLFAALLETAPGLQRSALMSAQPRAARFEVLAESTEVVAAAVHGLPGYSAAIERAGSVVRARIAPSLLAEEDHFEADAVVPNRTRFRVVPGTSDTAPVALSTLGPSER